MTLELFLNLAHSDQKELLEELLPLERRSWIRMLAPDDAADLIQEYAVALSRTFVLREGVRANRYTPAIDRMLMTVRAHATWTDDDSNVLDRAGQAVFSYDRAVYGVSVAFTIN